MSDFLLEVNPYKVGELEKRICLFKVNSIYIHIHYYYIIRTMISGLDIF